MLYERWRQVSAEHGHALALLEVASGRTWTFAQLADAGHAQPLPPAPLACVAGHSALFVLQVLAAWREGQVLCPLETNQSPPDVPTPPPGCVHLKTTSASTGRPRLVAFTSSQLAADADNLVSTMGLRPDWPNLGVISLAHSYGFSNLILPLLLHGIPLIIGPSPLPAILRAACVGHEALTLPGVPALWRAWLEADAIPKNVRLAFSAGAPLPGALEREIFAKTGLKIHNFYGSSECGGIAYDRSTVPRETDNCVGSAVDNVDLSINEAGCMEVRGPAVGETYWPESSDRLQGGIFKTTDLSRLENRNVYLCGRATDLINVAGRKVAPESIEAALARHPAVRECLTFGVASEDHDRGETIVAVVMPCGKVTARELKDFLLAALPAWQVPRHWWLVEQHLADHRGKVSRAEWRKNFVDRKIDEPL